MMEAARTSETSVDIQLRTRHYIPADSELHTRRRENLKSHIKTVSSFTNGLLRTDFLNSYCLSLGSGYLHVIFLSDFFPDSQKN
jgi:hypothetical protein